MPFSAKLFPNFTMVAKDTRLRPAEGGPGGGQGERQPGWGGAQPGGLAHPPAVPAWSPERGGRDAAIAVHQNLQAVY